MQAFDGSGANVSAGRKVLLVAPKGQLRRRLARGLERRGYQVTRVKPDTEDLFSRALGKQAIVFAPTGNLLEAQLARENEADEAESTSTRTTEVLRASNAPGVELIVCVLPLSDGYHSVVGQVKRHGKPYVILRAPALLEEVAESALRDAPFHLWLPRSGAMSAAASSTLLEAVSDALVTEQQGRENAVTAGRYHLAGLVEAAAFTRRRRPHVHAVPPLLYRWVRPMARWLRGGEPVAMSFADRVLGTSAMPRQRSAPAARALPRELGGRLRVSARIERAGA